MEWTQSHEISRYLQLHRAISTRYERVVASAARAAGLTKPEADVLLFLANNPRFNTARDVAAYRGFSKTYVSKALEHLTRRGYITAETDLADRRVLNLYVTEFAGGAVALLQAAQRTFFNTLTDRLSDADGESLRRVTELVQENLSRL